MAMTDSSKRVLVVMRAGTPDAPRLTTALVDAGYRVSEAGSVPDARRLIADGAEPDAVVVSTDLPVVYGWELVARMRSDRGASKFPVIVLGDRDTPENRQQAEIHECTFLPLPVAAADIVAELDALIKDAQRSELRGVRVLLLTDVCEIEGTVHVPPGFNRFSDGWEAVIGDPRSFVPVTDARLSSLDGERLIAVTAFLQLPKAQLRAVLPVDDRPIQRPADQDGSAALIGKLTRVAAGLAKELADQRNVPVRDVLEDFVTKMEVRRPSAEAGDAVS